MKYEKLLFLVLLFALEGTVKGDSEDINDHDEVLFALSITFMCLAAIVLIIALVTLPLILRKAKSAARHAEKKSYTVSNTTYGESGGKRSRQRDQPVSVVNVTYHSTERERESVYLPERGANGQGEEIPPHYEEVPSRNGQAETKKTLKSFDNAAYEGPSRAI